MGLSFPFLEPLRGPFELVDKGGDCFAGVLSSVIMLCCELFSDVSCFRPMTASLVLGNGLVAGDLSTAVE